MCQKKTKRSNKKKTTEEFIVDARDKHGNKYDYSLVGYKNAITKVQIICPTHGVFEQTPNKHLSGTGCPECGRIKKGLARKRSPESFIKDAILKHGNKYDYSLVEYKNTQTKVKIICPVHGVFEQTPNKHLSGQGCPKCGHKSTTKKQTKSTEQFIIDSYCKHGDKYNYSLVEYKNRQTKVKIICPIHGEFEQRPSDHLAGRGCNKCGNEISGLKQRFDIKTYIDRCGEVHNDKYDYSLIEKHTTIHDKVQIICPVHGVFEQKIGNHLYKEYGCPKCSNIVSKQESELQDWLKEMAKKYNTERFIKKANSVHDNRYDYSLVEYKNVSTKVKIICPIHGEFEQRPSDHLAGRGCSKCQYDKLKSRRKSTEQFIIDAYCKHGDKYNYSLVEYKNTRTPVKIICPIHGVFEQIASYHLSGNGCTECGKIRDSKSLDYYIKLFNKVHHDKYDYSLIKDINNSYDKIKIICPVHGVFEQRLNNHLYRLSGCPKCSSPVSKQESELQDWLKEMSRKRNTERFIEKANSVHNNKYDYSLVDYKNSQTKVKIICPVHGVFGQRPSKHISGQGCPECGKTKRGMSRRKSTEEFISDAHDVHGDKHDYSLVDYENAITPVKIICPTHGVFEQTPNKHLSGTGCPECSMDERIHKLSKSTDEFISDARNVHGDKYDYSLVEYKNRQTKIKIICPVHGVFEQRPGNHLSGMGCPECGNEASAFKQRFGIKSYIDRCKKVHHNKYDYSYVDENSTIHDKVKIICPAHGVFEQKMGDHLYKEYGCPKCSSIISKPESELQDWLRDMATKYDTERFIEKAHFIHGDKYDYSLVDYKNMRTKIKVICPIHGVFEQKAYNHLNGQGCPKCGRLDATNKQTKSTEEFISDARDEHGDKYDYSLVDYKSAKKKVKIICPTHGVFEQRPDHHLNGSCCPKCQIDIKKENESLDDSEFIERSSSIHNDKYDYSLVNYKNMHTKVKIICPVHGEFEQVPDSHLHGNGCPKCSNIVSKQESELQDWLKGDIDIITNDRELIAPFELDIVIPSHKIAIEFNGIYWHSETMGKDKKYHIAKYKACEEKGYRLIQIWENEWFYQKDIVKSFIMSALGIYKRKIHGRKCEVRSVDSKTARKFYDQNHIQGFQGGEHHGLYFNDDLVSLMTIKRYKNEYMLERFVNLKYTMVYGAFSKLLKSFDIDADLCTFADVRHFSGSVYTKNGFDYVYTTAPNYWYFRNGSLNVYHRRHFQKKRINTKYKRGELEYYDPNETEYQNMLKNGFHRIWDCGNIKFIKRYEND